MNRHYHEVHKLTVAKHPSETDERLMVGLVAFTPNAHEHLEMTNGLSMTDQPDFWLESLSGELNAWVALGLPSQMVVRQLLRQGQQGDHLSLWRPDRRDVVGQG